MVDEKGTLSWDQEEPPGRAPARQPARAPPPAAPPARPPSIPARRPPPSGADLYVPPSYKPSAPSPSSPGRAFAGFGPAPAARQPAEAPPPRFSSSLDEWQANRDASRAEAARHEDMLRSRLEREPGVGPSSKSQAPQGPGYGEEPLPPSPRPRIKQWPVVKSLAIIIIAVVILSALQLHGEMGEAREFLREDLSRGLPTYRIFPLSSEFSLNRQMTTTCRGGEITYSVDVSIPQGISGQQEIVELGASPDPTHISGGYWNWSGTIYTGQTISVTINYHSKSYFYQWVLGAGDSGTTAQVSSSYTKYLGDCWKFTPGDSTISGLAAQIAGNTTNVFEKLARIYEYTHENIAYLSNSPEEPKSPTRTLADGNGDCDDQSFFMGSLLRAQGVPAWMELGLLYDQSTGQWGGHAWLRVLIPEKSGGERVVNIDPANNEFLFRDPFRFTDYIDDGNDGHLQNYYVLWRYSYIGAAPQRDDRFDSIYFRASSETTGVRGSGPSLPTGPQASLWKAPGFEAAAAVLALVSIVGAVRASGRRKGNS